MGLSALPSPTAIGVDRPFVFFTFSPFISRLYLDFLAHEPLSRTPSAVSRTVAGEQTRNGATIRNRATIRTVSSPRPGKRRRASQVRLPDMFERTNQSAVTDYRWQWVFPSYTLSVDPRTGWRGRHHVHEGTASREISQPGRRARLTKRPTAHRFRHGLITGSAGVRHGRTRPGRTRTRISLPTLVAASLGGLSAINDARLSLSGARNMNGWKKILAASGFAIACLAFLFAGLEERVIDGGRSTTPGLAWPLWNSPWPSYSSPSAGNLIAGPDRRMPDVLASPDEAAGKSDSQRIQGLRAEPAVAADGAAVRDQHGISLPGNNIHQLPGRSSQS